MSHHDTNTMIPMIVISIIAALLSTMNFWVYNTSHIRFHLNDVYMATLMTSWMVFLDAIYYSNNNYAVGGFIGIIISLYLIRNQVFINDYQFIEGMIPHHSMAILMAEKIKNKSKNEKVIKLANDIIKAQKEEIKYMEELGY